MLRRMQPQFIGTIWIVILFSCLVILFTELAGVCVYKFNKELCTVSDSTATFTTEYWGRPYVVHYSDYILYNRTNVTCYIKSQWLGPAIELDTSGMIFSSCGVFTGFAITMYVIVLLVYMSFLTCC